MKTTRIVSTCLFFGAIAVLDAQRPSRPPIFDVWASGKAAFGVYAPNENTAGGRGAPAVYSAEGGERLAANPLYDFVFLNLEGRYDSTAVKALADGLRSPKAVSRKALIVRIPAFHEDPVAAAIRLREIFAAGGDGITFPHVQSVDEARRILALFHDNKINVWSPDNPKGDKIAMMMIEDPGALAQVTEFANLKGYSILACGIGSLRGALGGDTAAAEAGTQKVLAESKRAKLVNMLPANAKDVEQRLKEGFTALLGQGAAADEMIKIGRAAAGR
jgi:hypothetical protein